MTRRRKKQIGKELGAIASLRDSDIDTSDIPEITDWSRAVVGKFYRSAKIDTSRPTSSDTAFTPRPLPVPIPVPRLSTGIAVAAMTEQQLVLECIQGGAEAWDEFLRRFQKLIASVVVRTSTRWGNISPEVTENLIQEVYLKLCSENFRLLRQVELHHENAFLGYLKVIASNVVHDYFRAASVMKRGSGEPLLDANIPGSVETLAQAETDVLLKEINRLLESHASKRDRAMFWLHYRHGFTAKEIANIPEFNLTVKGVESIIHRLTQTLKREQFHKPSGLQDKKSRGD